MKGGSATPSPAKKAKTSGEVTIVPISSLPQQTVLADVKLKEKGQVGLTLKYAVGGQLSIHNTTNAAILMQEGSLILGFGKAKFKLTSECADPGTQQLFEIKSSDDLAILNGTLTTVGSIVDTRRKTEPDCKIAYHEIAEVEAGEAGAFGCTLQTSVYFVPDECNKELNKKPEAKPAAAGEAWKAKAQMNLGEGIPPAELATSTCSKIVWVVKWSVNGLMPVRPVLVLTEEAKREAGHALVVV